MRTPRKADPRGRILEVADRLFYADGVRATGTEKIMSLADVAKATFYRHFESKDALVLAYLENRDRALWEHLSKPTPPKDLREALTKLDRMANRPDVTGCPFLRVASEYPDPTHPFHRRVVEHQNKILDYLADLLKPFAMDRRATAARLLSVINGALSMRLVFGTSKEIPLLKTAESLFKQTPPRRRQAGMRGHSSGSAR